MYPLLLHGRHSPQALAYEPLGPWLVPAHFGSAAAEHRALRRGAALIDYSILSRVEVTGSDARDFLQRLLTNDVRALQPGGGCRAALLTPNGRLIAETLVL